MAVLYRKYRPQTFADVLNQKYIIQTLKNQVQSGQVSHAYLFTGTRGVGKTSVARILAKAVNCEKKKAGEPCGQCPICKQIEQGNFMDLVEIDAASNTGVDNIRELIEHIRFSPTTGSFKVFIIDEVHMLSKGAFNALLKTLEEPPRHAIFILATTEIGKVPATIISRTQRFDFKRLSPEDLEKHLERILKEEKFKLPKSVAQLVAQNAEGSVRDALSLLDKVLTLGEDITLEESEQLLGITDIAVCEKLLDLIAKGGLTEIPEFFDDLQEKGFDFSVFNRDFLEYLRKVLVYKVAGQKLLEQQHQKQLADLAAVLSMAELIFIIRLFLRSYKDLAFSPSVEIPLLVSSLEAAAKRGGKAGEHILPQAPAKIIKQPAVESSVVNDAPAKAEQSVAPMETEQVLEENADIAMQEIRASWPQVIAKVKELNGPLASLLKIFPLQIVSGNALVVGVDFLFHKQNLEVPKNQVMLSKVLEEVYGKKLRVRGQVIKEEKPADAPTEALADALKIFGGELVE